MTNANEVAVFTVQLVNEVFVLPQGARTIDLNNIGAGTATYIGNTNKGGKTATAVSIAGGVAYSFGDLGKPYPEITIDATGTTIDLTANY